MDKINENKGRWVWNQLYEVFHYIPSDSEINGIKEEEK